MKALLCALFVCFSVASFGQTGNYFLSHYAPSEERFDYLCFDMVQDSKGVMYFATKAGILEFNGRDWDLLPSPSPIYSVQISKKGNIYWAGSKGFGKIGLDDNGFQKIESLSDSSITNVFQTLIVNGKIIFLSEEKIFTIDETQNVSEVLTPVLQGQSFIKLFELYDVPYVYTDYGIYKIEDKSISRSKLTLDEEIVFVSRIDDTYVIATASNRIYSCTEDLTIRSVELKDQAYVDASVIVSGGWLNRQLLALGTLRGGVIFVNPLNGLTQEIVNYSTGLPDNEVFELMIDANENVWVSHDYGFTKIAPYIPLRSFSHYQGIQGNLLCVYSSKGAVYVGTSLGLFKLEKIEVYDELVFYDQVEIKEPKKTIPKSQPKVKEPVQEQTPAEQEQPKVEAKNESKKGGLFSFLKKNKKDKAPVPQQQETVQKQPQVVTQSQQPEPDAEEETTAPRYKKVKRTERILRSSQYVYRKVSGIDAKISQLAEVKGKILASGLGGLFEVNNLTAKPILEEPVRYIFAPENNDIVVVSTYHDDVRSLRFVGNSIENSSVFTNLVDQIHFIFPGNEKELWFCGIDKIYRAEIKGSDIRHKQTLELLQRNTDKTVGIAARGEIVFVNADGFYRLDRQKNSIIKIDTLQKPAQYFAHNGNIVYHDNHAWQFFGESKKEINLQLLSVFKDIRLISSEKNNASDLWLISGGNELYKYFGNESAPVENDFPIFLKSIINHERKIARLTDIIMDQEHSSVKFEVVQPDYINPEAVEFRYLLRGMQEEWSEWSSTNNIIQFPYLPTGKYTLEVQGKNIFGKLSELEPLSFEVLPPYWKRSWFYALEFAVFASLVILSFRLSTRYRIISRLLSLLTIILLITFIQTVIGSVITFSKESPVVDFFIQVLVALLVLPVEGYLRNLMLRSLDSSGKFYEFLVPRSSRPEEEDPEKFIKETLDVDD